MKAYVMDAFSEKLFGGNQAGVALPECPLSDAMMQQIAAEFKHSETAFVTVNDDGSVTLRYFTPAGEVDLCGHATIASFALLRQEGLIADGSHIAHTKASDLNIGVSGGTVWMDMAPPKLIRKLTAEEWPELYDAYGLTVDHRPDGLEPWIGITKRCCRRCRTRRRSRSCPAAMTLPAFTCSAPAARTAPRIAATTRPSTTFRRSAPPAPATVR